MAFMSITSLALPALYVRKRLAIVGIHRAGGGICITNAIMYVLFSGRKEEGLMS